MSTVIKARNKVTVHHAIPKIRFADSRLAIDPDCGGANLIRVWDELHVGHHSLHDDHTPDEVLDYYTSHTVRDLLTRKVGPGSDYNAQLAFLRGGRNLNKVVEYRIEAFALLYDLSIEEVKLKARKNMSLYHFEDAFRNRWAVTVPLAVEQGIIRIRMTQLAFPHLMNWKSPIAEQLREDALAAGKGKPITHTKPLRPSTILNCFEVATATPQKRGRKGWQRIPITGFSKLVRQEHNK